MHQAFPRFRLLASLLALIVPLLAACSRPLEVEQPSPSVVRQTVIVHEPTEQPEVVQQTAEATTPTPDAGLPVDAAGEAYTTPHPILGDLKVRQAIAYCTDRRALIRSVYPYLDDDQQAQLLMNTNLPAQHWAATDQDITIYDFDPAQGKQLLSESGWNARQDGVVRTNAAGDALRLVLIASDSLFRQTWTSALEQQLLVNCGIQVVAEQVPEAEFFGADSRLQQRDFELAGFAWIAKNVPDAASQYDCDQIPLESNNWQGQNYMGWCNQVVHSALLGDGSALERDARIEAYATVQQQFTRDMVSLPLFQRSELEAANKNLRNWKPDATERSTANADEWSLSDGGETLQIGSTREPASLWSGAGNAGAARLAADLLGFRAATTYGYDVQPAALTRIPTLENGGATNVDVDVQEGDIVWDSSGEAITLTDGVEVRNAAGEHVTFDGSPLKMKQLSVDFEYANDLTWEDGVAVSSADFQLAARIDCDPATGTTSLVLCASREKIDFSSDTTYTITYRPGVQWPEYALYTLGVYPAHQVLEDGRKLADVSAREFITLSEITDEPLSAGPYKLVRWQKGQQMVFEANEEWYKGTPAIKQIIIHFFETPDLAVAQLLSGDIDILDKTTLSAGPLAQTVLDAAVAGTIQARTLASPAWEHLDMNLATR